MPRYAPVMPRYAAVMPRYAPEMPRSAYCKGYIATMNTGQHRLPNILVRC